MNNIMILILGSMSEREVTYTSNINYISYSNVTLIHVLIARHTPMGILARKWNFDNS